MQKAILYTTATLNGSWFLATIDCAIWLSEKNSVNEIHVISYPINKCLNPFQYLLKLKNFLHYWKKLWKKIWKNNNVSYEFEKLILDENDELHKFMTSRINEFSINYKNIDIRFTQMPISFNKFHLSEIFSNIKSTIAIYKKYFTKNKLYHKKYLEFKSENCYLGLHILSEAMRSDYRSFGSIFNADAGILTAIYKFVMTKKIIHTIPTNVSCSTYVCGPDQEYTYGVFSQLMSKRGARFIEMVSEQEPFVIQENLDLYYKRPAIKAYPCEHDQSTLASLMDSYFHDRVTAPWKVFPYMDLLKGTKQKPAPSFTRDTSKLTVVIYLHSFTDAQYVFGHDGYHDLEDWTISTVKALYSNQKVGKIIVKPHPGIDPVYHPGDVIANRRLRKRLTIYGYKVIWADYHFNTQQLINIGKCLAITHHGSVAEEASYLGIPLIASAYGPWGTNYSFGHFWSDKDKYETLLRTLDVNDIAISADHQKSLFEYVKDKNFSSIKPHSFDESSTWLSFLSHFGVSKHHEFSVNMEEIKVILLNINQDDGRFKSYLTDRLSKIKFLCSYKSDFDN
ncbi:hypothetical protein OAI58_09140 [Amylibacter sp.]|nr:hypothetical protein [Amylibacter sp.]